MQLGEALADFRDDAGVFHVVGTALFSSASLKGTQRKNVVYSATASHLSVQQVTRCDKFMC